jgi:hypothetical protein
VERANFKSEFASMRSDIRNLVTAQEFHYSRHRAYSASLEDLGFRASRDVTVRVFEVSERGYWLVASHSALRSVCVLGISSDWPLGELECM